MAFTPRAKPTFGHPIRRDGKPYIWGTWLAKLLGGDQCLWSGWFKAHFQYAKFEQQSEQLAEWNRDHIALMRRVRAELEENGWTCAVEDENQFKVDFPAAVVAGKPDLIGTMPGQLLVVDGKTGREREADWWQVVIYMRALQLTRPRLVEGRTLEGIVYYKRGNTRTIPLREITDARRQDLVEMVKVIAGDTEPPRAPSRHECERCNIGYADCPKRWREDEPHQSDAVEAGAF